MIFMIFVGYLEITPWFHEAEFILGSAVWSVFITIIYMQMRVIPGKKKTDIRIWDTSHFLLLYMLYTVEFPIPTLTKPNLCQITF